MKLINSILLFTIVLLSSSCVQYRDLISYDKGPQIVEEVRAITNYQPIKIETNDIISIQISSLSIEAAAPFNGSSGLGYLVDTEGNITLPTLGDIAVAGKNVDEIKLIIQAALQPYFTEKPIVNVRLQNFKINVNGEIGSPGVLQVPGGRMTILEAITRAGDFTPYSRRDSILIIREVNEERTFGYVDFNSSEVFESPYFYLKQNDVVYVRPRRAKVATVRDPVTRVLPFISIVTGLTVLALQIFR